MSVGGNGRYGSLGRTSSASCDGKNHRNAEAALRGAAAEVSVTLLNQDNELAGSPTGRLSRLTGQANRNVSANGRRARGSCIHGWAFAPQ